MATTKQIVNSFKNSVKKGTPASQAIFDVAKRWKTTPTRVSNVVTKEKLVTVKSFNGQKVYWANFAPTGKNSKWSKEGEFWFVQWAINWAFANGWAKPEDFKGMTPRQTWFFLAPKFNKYFKTFKKATKTTKTKKSTPKTKSYKGTTSKAKKSPAKKRTYKKSTTKAKTLKYKGKTTGKTRRYRKAA